MPRLMFDGIDPAQVPGGADIYAGYDDGEWQSLTGLMADHPGRLYVSICVTASGSARVLDIENGDATPDEAPGWATRMRAAGNPYPVCYMNESTWANVQAAFADQHVEPPLYWVAAYVNDPSRLPVIPAGTIACQFYDYGGYDASVVADYWPGLDPAPKPQPTPAINPPAVAPADTSEDDMQQIEPTSVHPGEYVYGIPAGYKEIAFVADGYKMAPARLRVVTWVGNACDVHDSVEFGGTAASHYATVALPAGCNAVTVRREDASPFPVGPYLI